MPLRLSGEFKRFHLKADLLTSLYVFMLAIGFDLIRWVTAAAHGRSCRSAMPTMHCGGGRHHQLSDLFVMAIQMGSLIPIHSSCCPLTQSKILLNRRVTYRRKAHSPTLWQPACFISKRSRETNVAFQKKFLL